jgi:hypothetical protein
MSLFRLRAAVLGMLAGCYSPQLPAGAPCDTAEQCPLQQYCVQGKCSLRSTPDLDAPEPEPDAPPPPVDAAPPPDAAPLACSTAGLTCTGTVTMFTCGGKCWVLCTQQVPREQARLACAGWSGALGQIEDAAEQTCVEMHNGDADRWIGLSQLATATTTAMSWTWNGVTPIVYTHWQAGEPNDGDGRENGSDQCGRFQTDGGWGDIVCTAPYSFFCERPQ